MGITSTEMKIDVSNGRITNAEVLKNGMCNITVELNTEVTNANNLFVLCEASKLSLNDDFMNHPLYCYRAKRFKKVLEEAIKSGLEDFYRPVYDPSLDKDENICYVAGAKPAVGKTFNWWKKNAKLFCPERVSRLGTKKEYIAFLGILIKKLSESGWSINDAWNAVCNDSKELGHYSDSPNAKNEFEPTGSRKVCVFRDSPNAKNEFENTDSRKICVFYDLANTLKILSKDEEASGFCIASGCYSSGGFITPLDFMYQHFDIYFKEGDNGVGWIVLEK